MSTVFVTATPKSTLTETFLSSLGSAIVQVAPEEQLYSGQAFVQVVLLLLALVCVPWMLCTRPYLEYREMQKIKEQGYHGIGGSGHGANGDYATEDETDAEDGGANGHAVSQPVEEAEESHDFGEVVIHQVIRESCVTQE